VEPERLAGWLDRFAAAHGALTWSASRTIVEVAAADGARASCEVPFPPLPSALPAAADEPSARLVDHAMAARTIGLILVRRGGYAVAVAAGNRVVASKVGSRHVQGRTAAGGWSQQRFARRRDNQAKAAFAAAADAASAVLAGRADLDAVVTGGDRPAIAAVLADPRLAAVRDRVAPRVIDVPEPRQRVLPDAVRRARAVRITVVAPDDTKPRSPAHPPGDGSDA
jgi:peptide subunit release factor 1 (eRF1)